MFGSSAFDMGKARLFCEVERFIKTLSMRVSENASNMCPY